MAGAAATGGPPRNLEALTDGLQSRARERVFWTDEQIRQGLRDWYDERRLRAPYPYVLASRVTAYADLRKLAAMSRADHDGWFVFTKAQMRSRLYDPVDQTDGRSRSVLRFVRDLAAIGAIELDQATVGAGKFIGLRFRLLAPPETLHGLAPVAQLDRAADF